MCTQYISSTWKASDSNDISSSNGTVDFFKVLFCFSEGKREEETERDHSTFLIHSLNHKDVHSYE